MPAASASASGLAGRYTVALFELANEEGALDAVGQDLQAVRALVGESADLRRLIRSPVLTREQQGQALAVIGERAGFYPLTRKFLGTLAQQRRLFALPEVAVAYEAMLAAHKGELAAEVTSAVALTDAQLQSVSRQLTGVLGQSVTLDARVDPALLGGLVVRVGSRMIDASIRTKLHRLELAMKGAA